jgi:3-ketosteroid 9alpha-monooxygenase subunit B
VPHGAGVFNRCYSLSSAPGDRRPAPQGDGQARAGRQGLELVQRRAEEGGSLHVLPPAAASCSRTANAPLLLFGGGSGITPMMSLIKSALRSGHAAHFRLFYANRDKPSIIFDKELSICWQPPGRLEVDASPRCRAGPDHASRKIHGAFKGSRDAEAYLCAAPARS